jgi:hypothetical protein
MIRLTIFFIVALALSSCNKQMIQLLHLKPIGKTIIEEKDSYVFENDSVKISYSFWAHHGKFEFTIVNKMKTPIYIDWKKSNLVYNSNPNVYWTDVTVVSSASVSVGVGFRGSYGISTGAAVTAGESVIRPKERITFLPPSAKITRNEYSINNAAYYFLNPNNTTIENTLNDSKPSKATAIYRESFNEASSLAHLTNFLTFSTKENFENEWFIENKFFLSEVNEMELSHFRGKCTGVDENENPICPRVLKSNKKYYLIVPKGYDYENLRILKYTKYREPRTIAEMLQ